MDTTGLASLRRQTPVHPGRVLASLILAATSALEASESRPVVIVGSGAAGLSAAWEAGRRGVPVIVIDRFSVPGGHAVMSAGVLMVDTPLQREKGIKDSAELAEKDFVAWGKDVDREWVRLYARRSREDIFEWLWGLGTRFDTVSRQPGNTVARFHLNPARGLGVVLPVYRGCLRYPNIQFLWNTEVIRLEQHRGSINGVTARNLRNGATQRIPASAVVLATGGYQSNLKLVRESWPKAFPFPEDMLIGSGANSMGSGLSLGAKVGAARTRMDHQWNYPWGILDPLRLGSGRGLTAELRDGIWVNSSGARFVNEGLNARDALAAVLAQREQAYWGILDHVGKQSFYVRGTGWGSRPKVERLILDNQEVTYRANTLRELALQVGIPGDTLERTVGRYNEMVDQGVDLDFAKFGPARPDVTLLAHTTVPRRIEKPPFYAVRMRPISRKSMGGLRIDYQCRVLNVTGLPILGLYAVGEVTGFGGINGSAALEGTFIGPGMLQGRIAGEHIAGDRAFVSPVMPAPATRERNVSDCASCHQISLMAKGKRSGFQHSAMAHASVLERGLTCDVCHFGIAPYGPKDHLIDRNAQIETCAVCHLARN